MPDPTQVPARELLTELAHLEDAVRATRTRKTTTDPSASPDGQLSALLAREEQIVSALHAASSGARS